MIALLFSLILLIAMIVSNRRPAATAMMRFWSGIGLVAATMALALGLAMFSRGYGLLAAMATVSLVGLPLVAIGLGTALGGASAALLAAGRSRWAYAILGLGTIFAIAIVVFMFWAWRAADQRRAQLESERSDRVYVLSLPSLPKPFWGSETRDFVEIRALADALRGRSRFKSPKLHIPGAPGVALSAACRPDEPDCLARANQTAPQLLKRIAILRTVSAQKCSTPILAGPNRTCVSNIEQTRWCQATDRRRQSALCDGNWPYIARLTFTLPQSQFALPDRDIPLILSDLGTDSTGEARQFTCSAVRDQIRMNNPHLGRLCTLRWWITPNLLAEVEFDGVAEMDGPAREMIERVDRVFAEFTSGVWAED